MKVFMGVDVGFTGAAAVLRDDGFEDVIDLPVVGEGVDKRIDARMLSIDLDHWRRDANDDLWHATVAIEKASAMPKQGISSAFRYGAVYGALRAVCEDLMFKVVLVAPGTWKKAMGLTGKGKEASRELAMRMFPAVRDELSRKKDHGRAEALLIAEWLRRQETGG